MSYATRCRAVKSFWGFGMKVQHQIVQPEIAGTSGLLDYSIRIYERGVLVSREQGLISNLASTGMNISPLPRLVTLQTAAEQRWLKEHGVTSNERN